MNWLMQIFMTASVDIRLTFKLVLPCHYIYFNEAHFESMHIWLFNRVCFIPLTSILHVITSKYMCEYIKCDMHVYIIICKQWSPAIWASCSQWWVASPLKSRLKQSYHSVIWRGISLNVSLKTRYVSSISITHKNGKNMSIVCKIFLVFILRSRPIVFIFQ